MGAPDTAALEALRESPYAEIAARAERFWSMVDRRVDDECWPWRGSRQLRAAGRLEYGRFYIAKTRVVRAHRAAWMLSNRQPVPVGMVVCHSCDVPYCCNPQHLWLGSVAENNQDRAAKGRTVFPAPELVTKAQGEAHGSAKLTAEQARAIYTDQRGLDLIARDYGIDRSIVARIRRGVLWKSATANLIEAHHD